MAGDNTAERVSPAELWDALDLNRPGLEDLREAVAADDADAARAAWARYMSRRRSPTLHVNPETWAGFMQAEFPAVAEAMVADACRVTEGAIVHGGATLPVQGAVPGGTIDWLHNPGRDTNYVSLVGSQWFMNPLGRAYVLTGDERFAKTFAWIFMSWFQNQEAICANQGGLGFNPVYRAYYPGVQSRILVDNYLCLAPSDALTPALHETVMRQLLANARFLERQEPAYRSGNQQVGALVGLGIIGLTFPELRESQTWVKRAESLMARHLKDDFFEDGGHHELCTQYHKTCLRDIWYVALTSENNGRPSPLLRGDPGKALERAVDWLMKLVTPTGETPPLHSAVFSTDYAVYGLLSAAFFGRLDHAFAAERFWERGAVPSQKAPLAFAAYLLAPSAPRRTATPASPPAPGNVHLEPSGLTIMRSGRQPDDRYLVAQYGWADSGHAYPAALSFVLQSSGDVVATHPGSPRSYRHPAYRFCHTTMAHNTVTVDEASYEAVNGIAPGGVLDRLCDLPGLWVFAGHHDGYKSRTGVVHYRTIISLDAGPVILLDRLAGGLGEHRAQWRWHTPLQTEAAAGQSFVLRSDRNTFHLVPTLIPERPLTSRTSMHWAAVPPAQCQPDDCGGPVTEIVLEREMADGEAFFSVCLFENAAGTVDPPANGAGLRARWADRELLVLAGGDGGDTAAGPVHAVADLVVALCGADGSPESAWVVNGTRLDIAGKRRLLENAPVSRRIDF